jgi:hypothetical protein
MIQTLHSRAFLGTASLLLLSGMLFACFWPFHAPRNTVSWVGSGPGLAFGRYGVVLGCKPLIVPGDREVASASVELWLQPDPTEDRGSILAIYSAKNPRQFSIEQFHGGLAVRSAAAGDPIRMGGAPSYTPDVFTPGKAVFITITSSERGTAVYVDGSLRKISPAFRITNRMLSGTFVAGTAASTDYRWHGQLRALAIYSYALNPVLVRENKASWMSTGFPAVRDHDGLLALYRFRERTGRVIHNEVPGGSDLYIPETYVVPVENFLSPPSLDNPEDIVANIVGFIPFGFFLCGYLSSFHRTRTQMTLAPTAVICGCLSLLIETLQTFLPTRDSSLTDVVTNFLGGTIGAFLYRIID